MICRRRGISRRACRGHLGCYALQRTAHELLVDALLRWRDTPGVSVLLPVHDEIIAMVPERAWARRNRSASGVHGNRIRWCTHRC
jgi:hypothetical protein